MVTDRTVLIVSIWAVDSGGSRKFRTLKDHKNTTTDYAAVGTLGAKTLNI